MRISSLAELYLPKGERGPGGDREGRFLQGEGKAAQKK